MWACIKREFAYLYHNKWDLALVTLVPCALLILFASMFYQGKAEHIPIAIIDQDQSTLSRNIQYHLQHNATLDIQIITTNQNEVEQLLNQTKIWGYVLIPSGAEQRLVKAQDAQIAIAYNQSFFSIGNTISSAMAVGTLQAIIDFITEQHLQQVIPALNLPLPQVKISTLFNPNLSYEFYLQPFVVPAILHLLLCCCVAFAVGQELKRHTLSDWVHDRSAFQALFAKLFVYVSIFCLWTWLWMFWLIVIRGWFVAGSLIMLLVAQVLLYSAYALISATIVLATKDLNKSFGVIAVYGGSSLSFAGVTLPLNNAPTFTQFWSHIIPYTPYAKLQTQQWVIGSPIWTSASSLGFLIIYVMIYAMLAVLLLRKMIRGMRT